MASAPRAKFAKLGNGNGASFASSGNKRSVALSNSNNSNDNGDHDEEVDDYDEDEHNEDNNGGEQGDADVDPDEGDEDVADADEVEDQPGNLLLDEAAQEAFRSLLGIETEMHEIAVAHKLDKLRVDAEYDKRLEPLWKRRNELAQKIPKFWTMAFENHPSLGSQMDQADLEVFNYLKEIDVEKHGEYRENFRIIFRFNENPFFTNRELSKGFINRDVLSEEAGYDVEKQEIHWREGKDLTHSEEIVLGDDGRKRKRETDSFFNWFLDDDWNVGIIICDDLFPSALAYYQNEEDSAETAEDLLRGDEYGIGDDDDEDDIAAAEENIEADLGHEDDDAQDEGDQIDEEYDEAAEEVVEEDAGDVEFEGEGEGAEQDDLEEPDNV